MGICTIITLIYALISLPERVLLAEIAVFFTWSIASTTSLVTVYQLL